MIGLGTTDRWSRRVSRREDSPQSPTPNRRLHIRAPPKTRHYRRANRHHVRNESELQSPRPEQLGPPPDRECILSPVAFPPANTVKLPHVHLVSSYRFPITPALQPTHALEYLLKGPTIVKDTQPVAWTYFPAPPADGTILLTWQPPRMLNNFASDGLVWADAEIAYEMQVKGYVWDRVPAHISLLTSCRASKCLSTRADI